MTDRDVGAPQQGPARIEEPVGLRLVENQIADEHDPM